MSIQSWKEEFYNEPAESVSAEDAVDHCIKKWTGLLKKNLKKHKAEQTASYSIKDEHQYEEVATSGDCALCHHYQEDYCEECPLYISRGNVKCFYRKEGEDMSPYNAYCHAGDARPMVAALRRAKKFEQKQLNIKSNENQAK